MMTKLREMTKIFIYIVAGAFVAMMVVEWGANYAGFRKVRDYVAVIDGEKVKVDDYQRIYQQFYDQERQRGTNEAVLSLKAHEMAWEQILINKVLKNAREKYGIEVTPEEIAYYTTNIPPEEVRRIPQLYKDGNFDMETYRNLTRQNKAFFEQIYAYYKEQLPSLKLDEVLSIGGHASFPEGVDAYLESNATADIEYLYIPRLAFRMQPTEVSDEDARKYYNQHKDEFKRPERRELEYVVFQVAATKDDSLKVDELAKRVQRMLEEGEDFLELAEMYSDDDYAGNKKGDMGFVTLEGFGKSVPELATAKIGQIIGPKKEIGGYKFYKVVERKSEKDLTGKVNEMVHLYSIYLAYKPSSETVESIRQQAEDFAELARKEGFSEAVELTKMQIKETGPFEKGQFVPGIGVNKAIAGFAFASDKGDISRVFSKTNPHNKNFYYVVRVKEIHKEAYQPFEEVINTCKARVEYDKREEKLDQYTKYVQTLISSNSGLQAAAEADTGKIVMYGNVTGHHPVNPLKDIGLDYAFSYFSFYLAEPGKVEGPVRGTRGVFFVHVLKRDSIPMEDAKTNAGNRLMMIEGNRRNTFVQNWLTKQKEALKVEDYRYLFYSEF